MDLDQQIDLRADRLTDGANGLDHLPLGVTRDVGTPGPWKRVELERGEPARHRLLRLRGVRVRGLGARVPAVRVDADPLAAWPTEQAHHRHAQALARQVPERLLEPADRAPEVHGAALPREVVVCPVREVADLTGVAPDEIARELSYVGDDGLIAIGLGIALAPAVQTVGRLDLHEEPVLPVPRIDDERRDGCHLHEPISLVLAYPRGVSREALQF